MTGEILAALQKGVQSSLYLSLEQQRTEGVLVVIKSCRWGFHQLSDIHIFILPYQSQKRESNGKQEGQA